MNRIKILRLVNNKTQKDIADYLGATRQTIACYEQGKRNPKPETWQFDEVEYEQEYKQWK